MALTPSYTGPPPFTPVSTDPRTIPIVPLIVRRPMTPRKGRSTKTMCLSYRSIFILSVSSSLRVGSRRITVPMPSTLSPRTRKSAPLVLSPLRKTVTPRMAFTPILV